jgi:hypothetical protein
MSDPPKPDDKPKRGWVAPFAIQLCVIAWVALVLTETMPSQAIKFACILFGSHASLIAVLTCLPTWLRFRQAIHFLLLVATSPPAAYFAVVVHRLARDKGWLD